VTPHSAALVVTAAQLGYAAGTFLRLGWAGVCVLVALTSVFALGRHLLRGGGAGGRAAGDGRPARAV
jgi:hypothetical protein